MAGAGFEPGLSDPKAWGCATGWHGELQHHLLMFQVTPCKSVSFPNQIVLLIFFFSLTPDLMSKGWHLWNTWRLNLQRPLSHGHLDCSKECTANWFWPLGNTAPLTYGKNGNIFFCLYAKQHYNSCLQIRACHPSHKHLDAVITDDRTAQKCILSAEYQWKHFLS